MITWQNMDERNQQVRTRSVTGELHEQIRDNMAKHGWTPTQQKRP